jgi:transposase
VRAYSSRFKFKIAIEAIKGNKSIDQIAEEHNLLQHHVSAWKNLLLTNGPLLFDSVPDQSGRHEEEDIKKLYDQIWRLEAELELMKFEVYSTNTPSAQTLSSEQQAPSNQYPPSQDVTNQKHSRDEDSEVHSGFIEPARDAPGSSPIALHNIASETNDPVEVRNSSPNHGTDGQNLNLSSMEVDQIIFAEPYKPIDYQDPKTEQEPEQQTADLDLAEQKIAQPRHASNVEKQGVRRRKHDKITPVLFLFSVLFLVIAALVYLLDPIPSLVLETASIAQPNRLHDLPSPAAIGSDWCISGNFIDDGSLPRLVDTGMDGDALAGDRIYSLNYTIPQSGSYLWHVANCLEPSIIYPSANIAWFQTDVPDQLVTFIFDTNEGNGQLALSNAFSLTAIDSTAAYRVVGDFQSWDINAPDSLMQSIDSALYQNAQKIPNPGIYLSYIIEEDEWKAIDAYGRTYDPIPFVFETTRANEMVVFRLDSSRGKATVYYDMPPFLDELAFGTISLYLSQLAAGISFLFLIGAIWRWRIFHNHKLWYEFGCPQCGQHELTRIPSKRKERFWRILKFPSNRYQCRNCTWEGVRLRDDG